MMILRRIVLICLFAAGLGGLPAFAQTAFKPVAVVNDSAITGFDLAQRAQILQALGRATSVPERLRSQALDTLIEDRLKLEAGTRNGLTPTDEVVSLGIDVFAKQLDMTGEELRSKLKAQGVSDQAIDDMIAAETIWREVVRARFLSRAEPSEARIDEEVALLSGISATEYNLRELGLRLTGNPEQDKQKREQIMRLYQQLSSGGNFEAAVQQYSESPSKASGGNLGWVRSKNLPVELVRDLNGLEPGGVTRPVSVQGGVALLQLLERRVLDVDAETISPEMREQIRQQLLAEEVNRLADGYLQELRRDALIEVR
ncbi:peptidylprolyl isomerase [Rhodobacteraceae bacterium NNCM2]|nr:peptidylprolyl isomerase [Coraliihabitans acroporae]